MQEFYLIPPWIFLQVNICSSSNRKKSKQAKDETLLSWVALYPMKRLVIIKFLLLYIKQLPLSQEAITHSLQKAEHWLHFFQCNSRQCSGQKRMIIMKDLTSFASSISAHKSWLENGLWSNLRQHQSFFLFFFSNSVVQSLGELFIRIKSAR